MCWAMLLWVMLLWVMLLFVILLYWFSMKCIHYFDLTLGLLDWVKGKLVEVISPTTEIRIVRYPRLHVDIVFPKRKYCTVGLYAKIWRLLYWYLRAVPLGI